MLWAITACKGRLGHLRQTFRLPTVVVDWGCPDGSGDWAESAGAVVVRADAQRWEAGRARAAGAAEAIRRGATRLLFLDADARLAGDLPERHGRAAVVFGGALDTLGALAVDVEDYVAVGGHTPHFDGCAGGEDIDLRVRLHLAGVRFEPLEGLEVMPHSDELRAVHLGHSFLRARRRGFARWRARWHGLTRTPELVRLGAFHA